MEPGNPLELIVVMSMFPDKAITLFVPAVRDKDVLRDHDGIFRGMALIAFLTDTTSSCATSIPDRHGTRELAEVCFRGQFP